MAISLKVVKAVAVGLGGLLIVGNILVVYALVREAEEAPTGADAQHPPAPQAPIAGAPPGFGSAIVPAKSGSEIIGTSVSDTRLVVHLKVQTPTGLHDELIVIDLATGRVLGELRLEAP